MVEIKPILWAIPPWDATKGTSVYFTYTGSKQSLDNELVITDTDTKEIVYNYLYSSFEKVHHLPPNQFENGKTYKAKLRVKSADGTYSPFSNEVTFKTFATPILDIDNIDGQGYVYNSEVTFVANYSQSDGEEVKTYKFRLYDENEQLMKEFPVRYVKGATELTEVVEGLEKGKGYFIECLIETVNGVVYTHRERFIPLYIVPSVNGVVSTRADKEEGFVRVTANLKQILGTQVSGGSREVVDSSISGLAQELDPYKYIDEDWIVIPSDSPVIFKGLGMNRASDFVMKVWCKDIPNNKKFIDISPVENEGIAIEFWKFEDRVVAIKNLVNVQARYVSNIVSIPEDTEFMLYAKVIEHRIDIELKIL